MKGMEGKPICVVNTNGFYDGFVLQLQRAHDEGILYGTVESYFHVETDVVAALDWCVETIKQRGPIEKGSSGKYTDDRLTKRVTNEPAKPVVDVKSIAWLTVGVVVGLVVAKVFTCSRK
jgi:hypothetical protein